MGFKTVIRGDQLEKRFKIFIGDTEQTDEDVDAVIVRWGSVQKSTADEAVYYSDGYWRFRLSEEETLAQDKASILCQVEIVTGNDKRQSYVFREGIGATIIERGGDGE